MAETIKDLLKSLMSRLLSSRVQHAIRRSYLSRRVIQRKGSVEKELAFLSHLIVAGDSVADIGANVGVYTRELSTLATDLGTVYSFEPVSSNYDILCSVVDRARLTNVHTFRVALSDCLDRREFVVPESEAFSGYYLAHFKAEDESGIVEIVDVSTLDHLWRDGQIAGLDFIKCDVEGSELEVIRGASELVSACHPAWLLEISRGTSTAVFELLLSFGYRAYVYEGHLTETLRYRDGEFSNYFFIHPKSKIWRRLANQQNEPVAAEPPTGASDTKVSNTR